jgi:secreted trypsin-like serine protease
MNLRNVLALCASAVLGLATVIPPAQAITNGEPDGDGHPYVGFLQVGNLGGFSMVCSGALIAPRVILTAGHCTFNGSGQGRVWFHPNLLPGQGSGFPQSGYHEIAEVYTHPGYDPFQLAVHEIGIVILKEDVVLSEYGQLPPDDVLDGVLTQRGLQQQIFNVVGYGARGIKPEVISSRVRSVGDVMLVSANAKLGFPQSGNSRAVLFSNNPGEHASGGTCFIDSGGPVLWYGASTIAAVQVFGMNGNCKGISGGYRIDRTDDLDFIRQFLP